MWEFVSPGNKECMFSSYGLYQLSSIFVSIKCFWNVLYYNYEILILPIYYIPRIILKAPKWLAAVTTRACKGTPSGDALVPNWISVFVDHEENNYQNHYWCRVATYWPLEPSPTFDPAEYILYKERDVAVIPNKYFCLK
jgi:hypothetical protein